MYFCYFVIISPWKGGRGFFWANLNSFHPRMLFAKFGWNRPSDSGEEEFLILSIYFFYFVIISTWKRAGPFIWKNLNLLQSPGDGVENVKSLRQQWRNNGQILIRKAPLKMPLPETPRNLINKKKAMENTA